MAEVLRVTRTRTPKDPKVVVARRGTEKSVVWSGSKRSSGRKTVKQVDGGVEALSLEAQGQRGLDQKGAHDVVRRANHPLSLAVLKKDLEVELSNSRPLSHCTALTVRPN